MATLKNNLIIDRIVYKGFYDIAILLEIIENELISKPTNVNYLKNIYQLISAFEKISEDIAYDWGNYAGHLPVSQYTISKRYTQSFERWNLTLRTRIKRLARKTICFSKSQLLHDTIIIYYAFYQPA